MGRFFMTAYPWILAGYNCLPIEVGGKEPAVNGWGNPPPGPHRHSPDSPKYTPEQYCQWANQFRELNVAVLPGSGNAMVVDVDNPALLDKVIEICGDTPFRTISGREGGGIHLWYAGATSSRNSIVPSSDDAGGVDIKSTGAYVIAPGSIHAKTSREYSASPELSSALAQGRLELPAPNPGWRDGLDRLGAQLGRAGGSKMTRLAVHEVAGAMQNNARTRPIARVLKQIADGDPFAEPGERDDVLFRAVDELVRKFPLALVEDAEALFRPSIEKMQGLSPQDPGPGLAEVREKWERRHREQANQSARRESNAAELRRLAWRWVGIDSDALGDPRDGQIVVHHGKSYFVRVGDAYAGPWAREEVTPDVLAKLAALYRVEVSDFATLLARHGVRAGDLRYSLAERRTRFDATTSTMHVAAAPTRSDLYPERSQAVERIVQELAGKYTSELNIYLAGLLRAEHPCRALVLSGPKGVGKSLLLDGIGRLWREGAVKMRDVLGKRFNSSITRAGFAVSDDDTSPAEAGGSLVEFIREAVTDRAQRLEKKHHDVSSVEGCMRYAIATNDAFSLIKGAVHYDQNTDSLAAFGDRILHIPVLESARGCWERAGVTGTELVQGDMIAKHILWLHDLTKHCCPVSGERFWVPAADESLTQLAVISSGLRGDILVRLHNEQPRLMTWSGCATDGIGAWLHGDAVVVSATKFSETWVQDRPQRFSPKAVSSALQALAQASSQPQLLSIRPRVHVIDRSLVSWYGERCGL